MKVSEGSPDKATSTSAAGPAPKLLPSDIRCQQLNTVVSEHLLAKAWHAMKPGCMNSQLELGQCRNNICNQFNIPSTAAWKLRGFTIHWPHVQGQYFHTAPRFTGLTLGVGTGLYLDVKRPL